MMSTILTMLTRKVAVDGRQGLSHVNSTERDTPPELCNGRESSEVTSTGAGGTVGQHWVYKWNLIDTELFNFLCDISFLVGMTLECLNCTL